MKETLTFLKGYQWLKGGHQHPNPPRFAVIKRQWFLLTPPLNSLNLAVVQSTHELRQWWRWTAPGRKDASYCVRVLTCSSQQTTTGTTEGFLCQDPPIHTQYEDNTIDCSCATRANHDVEVYPKKVICGTSIEPVSHTFPRTMLPIVPPLQQSTLLLLRYHHPAPSYLSQVAAKIIERLRVC